MGEAGQNGGRGQFVSSPGDSPLTDVPADYSQGAEARWFVVPEGPDAGKRMFFFDLRLGEGDGPLLFFVHGNPECSYAWRNTIKELKRQGLPEGTRIVAADNIGFGRSDQATLAAGRNEAVAMRGAQFSSGAILRRSR